MKYIIILGSTGMLGHYIYHYMCNDDKYIVKTVNRSDYDIIKNCYSGGSEPSINTDKLNTDKLSIDMEKILIDKGIANTGYIIINCIGLIPQTSQTDNGKYMLLNYHLPLILDKICGKYKSVLVQPSTDCVFSGNSGNYDEHSVQDETTIYGVSKKIDTSLYKNTMIIRTSIIGEELLHKYSLLEWALMNKDKQVNGYTNHYWNGITCLQFSKILVSLINSNILWNGLKHIHSPKKVSKAELLKIISNVYELNLDIKPIKSGKNVCDKSLSSVYDISMFNIPPLRTQIEELRKYNIYL